jgi:hypothetical protein
MFLAGRHPPSIQAGQSSRKGQLRTPSSQTRGPLLKVRRPKPLFGSDRGTHPAKRVGGRGRETLFPLGSKLPIRAP